MPANYEYFGEAIHIPGVQCEGSFTLFKKKDFIRNLDVKDCMH